jgi:serine/threonine protein kinase/Tol biopolymer transport system component
MLTAGTRLGSFEITGSLGAGGMGEVYRARDTKLGRAVAIKVILDEFASDEERVGRFEREAKMLAALNHPRIASLFGMEHVDGQHFLVMELVEGETLADRLRRGPMQVEDALPIAAQIAEGLEAAHDKGVVHRDLKPANVKITPDGQVKVLDFGLAKVMENEPASANAVNSPTLSMMATQAGLILGTAAYMSPEQAKGFPADHRSDVFAFGTVLFEMLTGRQPFQGDTAPDVLASVLVREPDLESLPPRLNPRLHELLRRCLEKAPKRRWQAIGDVRAEIETIAADPHGESVIAHAGAPPQPLWRRAIPIVATAIIASGLTGLGVWTAKRSPSLPVVRFTLTLPEGQQFTNIGRQLLAISPDGTQIVYVANQRLYLRPISALEAQPISGAEAEGGVLSPAFSPDGQFIAFWSAADQTLKRIAVNGGAAVTICLLGRPFGVRWDRDGIVAGQGGKGILRVSANGGKPELLVSVKPGEFPYGPQLLPDGQTVLFTLSTGTGPEKWDKAQVVAQSLKTGERHVIIDGGSDARYLPTGHLVYAQGGVLFATPFDPGRLSTGGTPIPIVEGVRRGEGGQTGVAHFAVANTGSLVYVPGPVSSTSTPGDLALIDRSGGVEKLKAPSGAYETPRVSPDGKRVALGIEDGKRANIWIYDLLSASSIRQLTFGGRNRFPVWTADSQRIAFQSDREGDPGIFWQRADGTDTARRLTTPDRGVSHIPESWSRTQDRFLFGASTDTSFSGWTFSVPDKKVEPFIQGRSVFPFNAVFSPDGRWVAYAMYESSIAVDNPSGNTGIFVEPFPSTGAKYRISSRGLQPLWSPDGKQLFYSAGSLFVVTVTTARGFEFSSPVQMPRRFQLSGPSSARAYDIMPDGQRLLGIVPSGQGQAGVSAQIQVVLNWFEELKRQVPTK